MGFDYHAARCLPGFDPNVKTRLLVRLRDKAEVIVCFYAGDVGRKKIRAGFATAYDPESYVPARRVFGTRAEDRGRCHYACGRPSFLCGKISSPLPRLRNFECRLLHISALGDESGCRKLGMNLTSNPYFSGKSLFSE